MEVDGSACVGAVLPGLRGVTVSGVQLPRIGEVVYQGLPLAGVTVPHKPPLLVPAPVSGLVMAVNDQLARQQPAEHTAVPARTSQAAPAAENSASSNGNGTSGSSGTHSNGATNGHRASQKQLDYVQQLARQIRGLGVRRLEALTTKLFSKPLADISSFDALSLIDTLKAVKAGEVDLEATLDGAAT